MVDIDNKTLQEMLAEVAPEKYQEGDYTMKMIVKEFGYSESTAKRTLDGMEKSGAVRRIRGVGPEGRVVTMWRKVE